MRRRLKPRGGWSQERASDVEITSETESDDGDCGLPLIRQRRALRSVQSADRLTLLSLQPLSLQQAASETFRYSVQSKQRPPPAIIDNLPRVPVCASGGACVCPIPGSVWQPLPAIFRQLLSVALVVFFSPLLLYLVLINGFSVLIVVFLQRRDARSSPAVNGGLCLLHYDSASCFSSGTMDVFRRHL